MTKNSQKPPAPTEFDGAMIAVVDKISSRATTGDMLLTLAIPLEKAALLSPFLNKIGKHIGVAFADLDASSRPATPKAHDYGDFARMLYANGFFRSPKVHAALGLEGEQHHEFVSKQIAASLGYESIGDVPPAEFIGWAKEMNLGWLVPASIRSQH